MSKISYQSQPKIHFSMVKSPFSHGFPMVSLGCGDRWNHRLLVLGAKESLLGLLRPFARLRLEALRGGPRPRDRLKSGWEPDETMGKLEPESLIFNGKITLVSGVNFPLNQSIEWNRWNKNLENGYTHRLGYNPYGPMLINGIYIIMIYLVGGAITILKNMSSSMGRIIPIYYGK